MATKDVKVPVSAVFEKRLAELVWENCPELARQTAAGRLALSLDFDSKEVQAKALDMLVAEGVRQLRPILREAMDSQVEESAKVTVERVCGDIQPRIEAKMSRRVGKEIDDLVKLLTRDSVAGAIKDFRPKLLKMADPLIAEEVKKVVKSTIHGAQWIKAEIHKLLDSRLEEEIQRKIEVACDEYFGQHNESFATVIRARVDAFVASQLEQRVLANPEAKQAINSGLFAMCSGESNPSKVVQSE